MNWVLILWYITKVGGASSAEVIGLSEKGCQEQAVKYMESNLPIVAVCVEKR
jgi:hypothetical protein